LNPEAVLSLHNTESGALFFVGAGPSLLEQRAVLPMLSRVATWTVNWAPQWDMGFAPDNYALSETKHATREVLDMFAEKWAPLKMRQFAIMHHEIEHLAFQWVQKGPGNESVITQGFAGLGDDFPKVNMGYCTIMNSMQLAAWMGYRQFYLVGSEFTERGYVWNKHSQREFSYRIGQRVEQVFSVARESLEAVGGSVTDCSIGGRLPEKGIVDYQDLEEAIECQT
jgi:hypothetical protein